MCFSPGVHFRVLESPSNSQKVARTRYFVHVYVVFAPQQRALFRQRNFQKWPEHVVILHVYSKCASRHNGLQVFDIATSNNRPSLTCRDTFYFRMCFAPQQRALFGHLNFQKWSEPGVFCTCSLPSVLRATTACTFSTSQLPKVHRT